MCVTRVPGRVHPTRSTELNRALMHMNGKNKEPGSWLCFFDGRMMHMDNSSLLLLSRPSIQAWAASLGLGSLSNDSSSMQRTRGIVTQVIAGCSAGQGQVGNLALPLEFRVTQRPKKLPGSESGAAATRTAERPLQARRHPNRNYRSRAASDQGMRSAKPPAGACLTFHQREERQATDQSAG